MTVVDGDLKHLFSILIARALIQVSSTANCIQQNTLLVKINTVQGWPPICTACSVSLYNCTLITLPQFQLAKFLLLQPHAFCNLLYMLL